MASFFGEIIEPSTRAIFDDFSDEEENTNDPEFQLFSTRGGEKLPSVIDVFFIVQGRLSLAFAEEYLLNENIPVFAEIRQINGNTSKNNYEYHKVKTLPSRLFTDENKVICLVSPSVLSELSFHFCQAITPLLRISKKVIIFTNESLYNYKTQCMQELPYAFIKQLSTSHGPQESYAESIETPNFITGISAGIISWCQIFKKNATAFICYTDQEKLDSITASPYLSILKKLQPDAIKNEKPNLNGKTFYGKPEVIGGSSNIYM